MLKFLDGLIRQYLWCIVEIFGEFWNEYNEYKVPKRTVNNVTNAFHCKKDFLKMGNDLKMKILGKKLCTHLNYSIMQHFFGS
jgi:hypothetical protein